jgi:hypothetical protein
MKNKLDVLSDITGVPIELIKKKAMELRNERKKEQLLEKLEIIRSGSAAITPCGEIVDRNERPDAMPYGS